MSDTETKKKAPFSAIQYSMKWMRKQGFLCEKTEQTVMWPDPTRPGMKKMVKRDLFNAVDFIAIRSNEMPIFCQTTTVAHQADRISKLAEIAAVVVMLRSGHIRVHVHGWAKKGPRGKAKFWKLTVTEVSLDEDGLLETKVLPGTSEEDEEKETGQKALGWEEVEPF